MTQYYGTKCNNCNKIMDWNNTCFVPITGETIPVCLKIYGNKAICNKCYEDISKEIKNSKITNCKDGSIDIKGVILLNGNNNDNNDKYNPDIKLLGTTRIISQGNNILNNNIKLNGNNLIIDC